MAPPKNLAALLLDLDHRAWEGDQARSIAEGLRSLYGETAPPARKAKRGAVANGSLGDRILGILKAAPEPVMKKAIVAGAGARELDVMLTVKELIADGRIKKTGLRAGTKYAIAKGGSK